jgi:hypothetical protein
METAIDFGAVSLAIVYQLDGIPVTLLTIHFPDGIVPNLEDGDVVLRFPIPVHQ